MSSGISHPPLQFAPENTQHDEPNAADAVLALSRAAPSVPSVPAHAGPGSNTKLLGAISTLLALTPRGRNEELTRLTALAHGFIGIASEDELVGLAKAVASREDMASGLADRLARTSARAAETLIRTNRLSDETIAYLLETGNEALQGLIARHHTLAPKHITMLVAQGSGPILQALLANRQTDFSLDTRKLVEARVASSDTKDQTQPSASSVQASPIGERTPPTGADPRQSAQGFVDLDSAGRRAVMRRLNEDTPRELSLARATRALDPTRNEADLAFLTVIEQRDQNALRDTFAKALDLDSVVVGKLLDEADGDALMVLAKGAGLSSTAFARMVILSKVGMSGSPRDTFALVDRFKALPQATADLLVRAIRGSHPSKSVHEKSMATAQRPLAQLAPGAPNTAPERPATRSIMSLAQEQKPASSQGFRRAV